MSNEDQSLDSHPVPPNASSKFQIVSSRGFTDWMASQRLSLAVSTYHLGAVIFLGLKPNRELSMFISSFDRAMGMCQQGSSLWLVTKHTIWKLENSLSAAPLDGFDRVFVPRTGHMTGDLDIHDIAIETGGRPVFVNTKFNCLATIDDRFSFEPLWRPPFIGALVPEDRCHLNGMALENGRAKYVTIVAKSDVNDGWRDFRDSGGLIVDVTTNEVIADGLSMPHSPRVHHGRLWLLNAGTGHFGYIDPKTRKFEPVTFLPGYARGLAFHGEYAIIGLSKQRRENAFQGLALDKNLIEKGAVARCGVEVVDLNTGAVVHWARVEPPIEELYDIAVLPEVVRPKALGFSSSLVGDQITHRDGDGIRFWSGVPAARHARGTDRDLCR